jgi:hypothetical protein
MTRGLALSVVGSVTLVALAGCGRGLFEQREPWRHEAELACLRSGAVREGPTIETLRPIDGPGICGADFPLRVSTLGITQVLGFADDLRPPGLIPQYHLGPARVESSGLKPLEAGPGLAASPAIPGGRPETPEPPERINGAPPFAPAAGGSIAVGPVSLAPPGTLACPVVSALDNWVSSGIQPAALRWFGQPVIEIKQISAYACRPMNGQRGAPISEHAFGNALDIAAFTLGDGRKLSVRDGWHGLPAERAFLHDVQATACQQFSTVLAPGSNAFHYDHIHVDLARHASGRGICNPTPVSGEVIARASEPAHPATLRPSRWSQVGTRVVSPRREEDDPDGPPGQD